jgi:RNA polymerase sigma factor (sigma-70 family)
MKLRNRTCLETGEGIGAVDDDASMKLVARWQAGDSTAADELFHRHADRLIALVRGRLSVKLARRLDPEDVLQSAYRSFFAGARAGRFEIKRGGDLWRLLVAITLHKLHDQATYHAADKRGVGIEQDFGTETNLIDLQPGALARDPSPLEAVLLTDEVEHLMRHLEPVDRRILELRLQGCDVSEIATDTNRSVATVYRVLERIKQRLKQGYRR